MSQRVHLRHHSLVVSVVWMTATLLLLWWAPMYNGLIAGALGGFRAHRVSRAVLASVVSTLLAGGLLFFGWHVLDNQAARTYVYTGLGLPGWMLVSLLSALVGAVAAALVSHHWRTRGRAHVPVPASGRRSRRMPLSRRREPVAR
jgi:uncharacterized membrane protein YedE/YeeE